MSQIIFKQKFGSANFTIILWSQAVNIIKIVGVAAAEGVVK